MSTLVFKRLFEVRFLHEFYLAEHGQGVQLFYEKSPAERRTYLEKMILEGRYDILRDLDIEPTPETAARLRGRQMKIGRNATGFFVGIEVVPETIGASTTYRPRKMPETGFRMSFFIRVKNTRFRAFTALRLRQAKNLPAFYFWTNAGKTSASAGFPSLSEPAPAFTTGQTYEPGEIALIGSDLYEAVAATQNSSAANWAAVAGQGYTTENDRIALPKQFPWTWTDTPGPAVFTLNDPAGGEVKKIEAVVTENSRRIPLNFARRVQPDGAPGAPISDGYYRLLVQGGSTNLDLQVYLNNELSGGAPSGPAPGQLFSTSNLLGMVEIVHNDASQALPLFDADGRLLQVPLSGGGSSHPVFEVRFLSRSAWWRYRSDRGLPLLAENEAALLLDPSGNDLVTKQTRRFFNAPQGLYTTPGAPAVWLPNPPPEALRPAPDGKLFAETLISKIPNLITTS
ncbi:MAG: hypothetical protein JNL02_05895 [Saprospiraceae bacterium]|nr:hypothetical protein [Saprospiraceae bacterium]